MRSHVQIAGPGTESIKWGAGGGKGPTPGSPSFYLHSLRSPTHKWEGSSLLAMVLGVREMRGRGESVAKMRLTSSLLYLLL